MTSLSPEEIANTQTYDDNVESFINPYDAHRGINREMYAAYEDFWVNEILGFLGKLGGKDVLSLGCGTAPDAVVFHEEGAKYIGIDLSAGMLAGAVSWETRPAVARMNMRQLGFRDSSFDGVWAFDSFSNVPKRLAPEVLAEMRRVVRDNGLIYLSTPEESSRALDQGDFFIEYYQRNEFRALVEAAGLKIVNPRNTALSPFITYTLQRATA